MPGRLLLAPRTVGATLEPTLEPGLGWGHREAGVGRAGQRDAGSGRRAAKAPGCSV